MSVRPRVLVVSLGRRGGSTDYAFLMARGLTVHADVAVVSSSGSEYRERWRQLGVPVLEVPTFATVPQMLLSFFALRRFFRIRRFARSFGPDIVYYPSGHAWKLVLDLILPTTATTVLTVHDPILHAGENTVAHRLFAAANRLKVDGYVLLNETQRETFIARYRLRPSQVAVIPLGVFDHALDACRPLRDVPGLERLEAISGTYALFIGRILPYKGLATLLEAFDVHPQIAAIPLVIAGEGELGARERALLDALPRPAFVLNRWLSETEVASLTAAARFVLLPYTTATQSGVILLASAFGVPSIASDAGGLREQVVDGETGILFAAGDKDALADALVRGFTMPQDAYERMREACVRYARTQWDWPVLARKLLDLALSLRQEE